MTEHTPIAGILASMAARQQRAYADLIKHTSGCAACDEHPLCADGRALWNRWKGKS
jgi:hypothetical protein